MIFYKSIDVEKEVRDALAPYMTAYCRPLPSEYDLPNLLITKVGGNDRSTIDTFEVVIDARAALDAEADEYLRTALGLLDQIAKNQTTRIRHVVVNTSGSWGTDPVRPDLAMCSARVAVTVHKFLTEV